jgi:hypothetical protein
LIADADADADADDGFREWAGSDAGDMGVRGAEVFVRGLGCTLGRDFCTFPPLTPDKAP